VTHSLTDWAAFLSLGTAIGAAVSIPFWLWVDADYLLIEDWQPLRDRALVETTRARQTARHARQQAAVTTAGLLLLLSAPTAEVTR